MRIYLIRHGETAHNRDQIFQGHDEVPLSDLGVRQAALLAQRMQDLPLDQIYSSDLRRAVMTASIIAAYTGAPIRYDAGFRERDPGELTGLPYMDAMEFFSDAAYAPPKGERWDEFEGRVRAAFEALVQSPGMADARVAVVAHGMVCGAVLRCFFGYSFEERLNVPFPNASITTLAYDGAWALEQLADASHLDALSPGAEHAAGA